MAEKLYYFSTANASTTSVVIGLSGIVKSVKIMYGTDFSIAAGSSGAVIVTINPNIDTIVVDTKTKFFGGRRNTLQAAAASERVQNLLDYYPTNFYVDKLDYLVFRNGSGTTFTLGVILDIVPVSDKTRLFLGGEYHNQ